MSGLVVPNPVLAPRGDCGGWYGAAHPRNGVPRGGPKLVFAGKLFPVAYVDIDETFRIVAAHSDPNEVARRIRERSEAVLRQTRVI